MTTTAPVIAPRPGEPDTLASLRLGGRTRFEQASRPREADEEWRYGRIDDLDLDTFAPVTESSRPRALAPGWDDALLDEIGTRAGLVRTSDGSILSVELDEAATAAGVVLGRVGSGLPGAPVLGEIVGADADAFTALADACLLDALELVVPAGVRLERPVVVLHAVGSSGEKTASFPRTLISLGAGSQASVVEFYTSPPGEFLTVPLSEIALAEGAHLDYHSIQRLGRGTWQLGYQSSRIARDAVLRSFLAAFGGDYARVLTRSSLAAENASSELLAVYLGDGHQVQDMRTVQEHAAPRTTSTLVFKGAVADEARSVYSGLIHIHKGAKRSNASQTNRNLVLSDGAHADSVPNLDIEENDVRCSHASAVGPIDVDQRFYLESRGVPPEIAERLILLGFFDDLLARAPEPGCAAYLRGVVAERLGASGPVEEAARK